MKISSLLKKYGEDKLEEVYNNKTYNLIPGLGKKKTQLIKDYFNKKNKLNKEISSNRLKKYDYIDKIDEIINKFKNPPQLWINQKNIIRTYINEENIKCFKDNIKWLYNINCGHTIKSKILNKWIDTLIDKKNNYKYDNILSYSKIISDPMLLKIIDISFPIINRIGLDNKWWGEDDEYRYENLMEFIIEKYCKQNGHVFLYKEDIKQIYHCNKKCWKIKENIYYIYLKRLIDKKILKEYKEKYMLYKYYKKEKRINRNIKIIKDIKYNNTKIEKSDIKSDIDITDEQLHSINGIINSRISILLGKGGTGKTSCVVKSICDYITDNTDDNILFLSPTHSAKNNGKNIIYNDENKYRIEYKTVASFVLDKFSQNFEYNNISYVFIDESSMICLTLFDKLLNIFIENNHISNLHIVLIGDNNQIFPIGVGSPFYDILNIVSTFKLTKNFRSKKTDIPKFCDLILNNSVKKKKWNLRNFKFNNVKIYESNDYKNHLNILLEKLKRDGYEPYSYDAKDDTKTFQIITLRNETCKEVNKIVRNKFLKKQSDIEYEVGDSIIMNKNTPLFKNGDIGKIIEIDHDKKLYYIKLLNKLTNEEIKDFKDKKNEYNIRLNKEGLIILSESCFKPCFAITVHSSQGLGFNVIIYIANRNDNFMINKNINYTAYSRAKDKLYLIGDIINFSGSRAKENNKRNTFLKFLLKNNVNKKEENNYTKSLNLAQNIRKRIPKKLRNDLWIKYCGKEYNGECYVNPSHKVTINNFHCGHVKAVKNGGTNNIENLRVICSGCNLSMGIQNLEEYKREHYSKIYKEDKDIKEPILEKSNNKKGLFKYNFKIIKCN